ncbi:MAG: hypothetical protein ABSA76_02340 [Bacteroidales bacterium]
MVNNEENSENSGLPPLSAPLTSFFSVLNSDNQKVFRRVFQFCWNIANSRRFTDRGNIMSIYWLIDRLRIGASLTTTELSLLTYIYQITSKGKHIIHSNKIYLSTSFPGVTHHTLECRLVDLTKREFIIRSTRNPEIPYLSRYVFKQPVWLRLSPSGVRVIEGIEKDMYKILLNSSLDDLTGIKKP